MIGKEAIRCVIDSTENISGKVFTFSIQFLIILARVTVSIATLPDLTPATTELLWRVEVITVAIFSLEYILRIVVAEKPLKFIFSFYGLVDLAAILPFYIASGLDLRAVRVFRLLRLLLRLTVTMRARSRSEWTRGLSLFRLSFVWRAVPNITTVR